jgi:hypothetical protein
MARILKAKYFPKCSFLQAKQVYKASYTWQSIQKASWILRKGCFWYVGNGQSIDIWNDRWIHPQGQKATWTPKPTNPSVTKVAELIDQASNNWQPHSVSQNFLPYETNTILQIPLTDPLSDDVVSWQGTTNGNYTVKSGYHAQLEWETSNSHQSQASNNQYDTLLWNKLWKTHAPPKQLHLMWRILHNAIPTKTNLTKRGICKESLCPRCNKSPETMDHVFLHCDWAAQAWFISPLTISTNKIQTGSFTNWLIYMITHTHPDTIQVIATITYCIWLARNNIVYNTKNVPPSEAVNKAL